MKYKTLLAIGMATLLSGCMGSIDSSKDGALERWTTFDGHSIATKEMQKNESRVVFLREEGAVGGKAVNIFVNGDYLASLRSGGYKEEVLCSTGDNLLATFTRNSHFADRDTGIDYNFVSGKTEYVKVVADKNQQPVLVRVSEQEGKQLLKNLDEQTQTVRRTNPNHTCKRVLEKVNISAHSLFKFNKSNYQNMLPKGKQEIQQLGKKINTSKLHITEIKVVGYTDPQGNDDYNLALSKRRAETVKQALKQSGVKVKVISEGLGENNLIVRNCAALHPHNAPKRKACDQVNRRVEIILYGQ